MANLQIIYGDEISGLEKQFLGDLVSPPANPPAGVVVIYQIADVVYSKNSAGTVTTLGSGAPAAKYLGMFTKNDGETYAINGTSATVVYNTEITDSENWHDNTTGILTATRTCRLRVSAAIAQTGLGIIGTGAYRMELSKNNVLLYVLGDYTAVYNNEPFQIDGSSVIVDMLNGDNLRIKFFAGTNHNVNLLTTGTNPAFNYFFVEEL